MIVDTSDRHDPRQFGLRGLFARGRGAPAERTGWTGRSDRWDRCPCCGFRAARWRTPISRWIADDTSGSKNFLRVSCGNCSRGWLRLMLRRTLGVGLTRKILSWSWLWTLQITCSY